MYIKIQIITGQAFALEVEGSDTIKSIWKRVKVITHTDVSDPKGHFFLVFAGLRLNNGEKTLADYNIQRDTLLYICCDLRG